MLSRVAETIYWMARQVERAENTSRFLEVTLNLILDQPENLVDPWKPLVQVSADEKWFAEHYGVANQTNVVQFLAFDTNYSNSMVSCLRHARENARGVREKMSSEAFEQLNEFYHFVTEASHDKALDRSSKFFDDVRRHTLLWTGALHSTMGQDTAWHFANLGRMLERADKTSRILDVKYFNLLPSVEHVGTAIDDLQWSALLMAISGFEAYQRDHHRIEVESVVSFFLFNRTFPRSIRHCVASAGWSLDEIDQVCRTEFGPPRQTASAKVPPKFRHPEKPLQAISPFEMTTTPAAVGQRDAKPVSGVSKTAPSAAAPSATEVSAVEVSAVDLVAALRHRLAYTSVKETLAGGMHQFVDTLQTDLNRISDAVSDDYFQTKIAP